MSTKRTMMKHTLKEWVAVTRYWSFPVSAMPVAVCFAYLFSRGLVPDGTMPWRCRHSWSATPSGMRWCLWSYPSEDF